MRYPTRDNETDERGRFTIFDARPPAIQVATPEGARHVFAVPRDSKELVLRLPSETEEQPASVVRGVVREASGGAAIVGATVALATDALADAEGATLLRRFQTASGTDGSWELDVPAGQYEVEVSRSELGNEKREVLVTAGRTAVLEVTLWRAGSLEFEFTPEDTRTRRPRRIIVEASIVGQPSTVRTTRGYPGGRATLTNLRAGATYTVQFSAPGFKTITRSFEAAGGNIEPVSVSMESESAGETVERER